MKDDDEDANNDKAYDEDTCDVSIAEACFDIIEVGGYACKAIVLITTMAMMHLLMFLFMTMMMMMTPTMT